MILHWFVDEDVAQAAISGEIIIEEKDVEAKPKRVPASCLDENVCLESCRKYFTQDAWEALQAVACESNKKEAYLVLW